MSSTRGVFSVRISYRALGGASDKIRNRGRATFSFAVDAVMPVISMRQKKEETNDYSETKQHA